MNTLTNEIKHGDSVHASPYYMCQCPECRWFGSSEDVIGGEGQCDCPVCMTEIDEIDAGELWNAVLPRLLAAEAQLAELRGQQPFAYFVHWLIDEETGEREWSECSKGIPDAVAAFRSPVPPAASQPYTVPDGDHENSDVVFSYKCHGCGKRPIIKHSKECSNYQEETVIQSDTLPDNGVTAEHQRVIEMLLKVCGAAFELADDTCEQEVDSELCITSPSDSFAKLSDALDEIESTLPDQYDDLPNMILQWGAVPRHALRALLQPGGKL